MNEVFLLEKTTNLPGSTRVEVKRGFGTREKAVEWLEDRGFVHKQGRWEHETEYVSSDIFDVWIFYKINQLDVQ